MVESIVSLFFLAGEESTGGFVSISACHKIIVIIVVVVLQILQPLWQRSVRILGSRDFLFEGIKRSLDDEGEMVESAVSAVPNFVAVQALNLITSDLGSGSTL